MARPHKLKHRTRSRHSRMSSSVSSAVGILLILASTSLSALHSHEVAPHNDFASAIESASWAHSATDSVSETDSVPTDNAESDWLECGLCDLGRRGSAEVAVLINALGPLITDSDAVRVQREAPERAKALALTSAGPRAPPLLSA